MQKRTLPQSGDLATSPIIAIPDHRMAQVAQMGPDLMAYAGFHKNPAERQVSGRSERIYSGVRRLDPAQALAGKLHLHFSRSAVARAQGQVVAANVLDFLRGLRETGIREFFDDDGWGGFEN